MKMLLITLALILVACTASDKSVTSSSRNWATPLTAKFNVSLIDLADGTGAHQVVASDGRRWIIPTHTYQPNEIGYDLMKLKEYMAVYQVFSPDREIIGFQESREGDGNATRILFIKNDRARLYRIVGGTRPRRQVRYADFQWWYTWELDSIDADGIILKGRYFRWRDLKLEFIQEFLPK